MRSFRFLAEARAIATGRELAETARRAEAMGIDVLVLPDHLLGQLAPIPAMATIAAATTELRMAAFVLNNDLRHPAVLAQDLASLDVLSEGRLEIAIGAGWNEPEYTAIGLPFDPTPIRQARLRESITVLKGCFAEGPFTFAGEHYVITDYDAEPKPVQKPHPPFFIGGGGRKTLTLAGQEAQIVGLAPRIRPGVVVDPRSLTLAATAEKIGWVREAAGERFADLEINVYPSVSPVIVTERPGPQVAALARRLQESTGVVITAEELLESPHIFIGSIQGLTEKFLRLRAELGISSIMIGELNVPHPSHCAGQLRPAAHLEPVVGRLSGS